MRVSVYFVSSAVWVAALLAIFMFSHGEASAQLEKDEVKCVNEVNKDAMGVAKAQAKAISTCVKDFGKGDLQGSIEDCLTSDRGGKVQKAKDKVSDKVSRLSPKTKCPTDPNFPPLELDAFDINNTAVNKELDVIHAIFGSDLDAVISSDPTELKCQQTVLKDLLKCQETKLKAFKDCKKNAFKSASPPTSTLELQELCLGENGTDQQIPDPKGKISGAKGKCDGKLTSDITKKCSGQDLAALFPGCAPADTPEDLQGCIDQIIECEVCQFAKRIDGLARYCDEFDDGSVNGSCRIGYRRSEFDDRAYCVGNDPNGRPYVDQPCTDWLGASDCPPGYQGDPITRCMPSARIAITATKPPVIPYPITLPLSGHTSIDCGRVDPNTGLATCQCVLEDVDGVNIPGIGFVCFQTFPDCPSGKIDCDGGTPMDVDMITNHDVGLDMQDPNLLDLGLYCGFFDPNTGNQQCEAACEVYCANLPGSYTLLVSDCAGYCQGGPNEDLQCTNNAQCPDSSCAGPEPSADAHGWECQCQCVQVAGSPGPPGAMYCQTGVKIYVYAEPPCWEGQLTSVVGKRCSVVTTESAHSLVLNADREEGKTLDGGVITGIRPHCHELARGEAVISTVGHRIFLDSDLWDQASATVSLTGTK
jgi:hypothetical protein